MGQHNPAKGKVTAGGCGNADAMEHSGPVSFMRKEFKAPVCKHLHAMLIFRPTKYFTS